MLEVQLVKMRRSFAILKFVHRQFPTFFRLKMRFFNTYIWPHLYMLSTIFCMLSKFLQNRVCAFYRRCLRLIFCLFECSTVDLHGTFALPTLQDRFRKSLVKRLASVQKHEPDLLDCVLSYKHLYNQYYRHYKEAPFFRNLSVGRPNKRIAAFLNSNCETYLDKLCNFVWDI